MKPRFILSAVLILSAFTLLAQSEINSKSKYITLKADKNDAHDDVWEKRHYYFKNTWGIRGSGRSESGEIWFNNFPGDSGNYKITLKGILEQDGSSPFAVKIADKTIYKGKFPYLKGKKDCNARGGFSSIEIGEFYIKKNQKISIWAQSVYECGEKGAYALWESLDFFKTKTLEN